MKPVPTTAALLLGLCGLVLSSTLAQAQTTPKLLGTHKAWEAYTYAEGESTVCFMLGRPQSMAAFRGGKGVKNVNRGEVYILVTHRPAQQSRNVVSINAGYPYKLGSKVTVSVDKDKNYEMFTAAHQAINDACK